MMSVYDKNYQRIGLFSNESPHGLHYSDDQLSTSINSGVYTLDLKIPKDTPENDIIQPGNYIERYTRHGKQLLLGISSVDETRMEKIIYAEDTNILVMNGFVDGINAPTSPQHMDYYLKHTLEGTEYTIGNIETEETVRLEFNQPQRRLERVREIVQAFGMELDFDLVFTPGKPPKRVVNALNKRVGDEGGFRISSDDLLQEIDRKVNIFDIATKIEVRGAKIETVETSGIERPVSSVPPKEKPKPENSVVERAIAWAFETAKRRLPYQWGGNGNPSYDCSGFVQGAYKAAGVNPASAGWPRSTTYSMWAEDGLYRRISKSQLQRGDLIMYDTGYVATVPNHVGIYLGPTLDSPNSVIHAGDPVGITQRANSMPIIGYVRVGL